jgi:hypothetical protein
MVTNLEDRSRFQGKLTNFSTNGFRVLLDKEMRPGSVVKVEWDSTMLLGEVIYCRREAQGFSLGIELEDALYDIGRLAHAGESS